MTPNDRRDNASKDYLSPGRQSSDLEWILMGIFAGLLILKVAGYPWGML